MAATKKKKALIGFGRLMLFPITQNDKDGYSVGEGFSVPYAEEMSKEHDASEQKIYSDDALYANIKSFNGMNVTITLTELTFELMEKLGFGKIDTMTQAFTANPQGENREFGTTFRCETAFGEYRMYKFYCFTVNEVKETGTKTKGSNSVNKYQVSGTFTARACDGETYQMIDGSTNADMEWLEEIEPVTAE